VLSYASPPSAALLTIGFHHTAAVQPGVYDDFSHSWYGHTYIFGNKPEKAVGRNIRHLFDVFPVLVANLLVSLISCPFGGRSQIYHHLIFLVNFLFISCFYFLFLS
jgi:hypothetical protein